MQTLKKTPKPLMVLKQNQTDHFNALQKKHFNDSDLIEDIRNFCKTKSALDREHAQSIQKLIQNLRSRRKFNMSDFDEMDGWSLWQKILQHYDEVAVMKLNTSDLLQRLSEQIKPYRHNRLSTNKRILEQLKCLQTDLFSCVQEMFKAEKCYTEDEKETYDVKIKADDAAAKVRNKSTSIFNSMADLHRNSNKLNCRLDAYQSRSTATRNEYLFQLAAVNSHLNSYFQTNIGEYARIIDADIHERLKELFVTITTDEYNYSSRQIDTWQKFTQLADKLSRDHHWMKFLEKNPSFNNFIEYKFHSVKGDKVRHLINPVSKEDTLGNVTKKLVKRLIVREHKIAGYEREIQSFESGRVTPPPSSVMSPNPPDSETGVEDMISYNQEYVEHKVEELQFAIRKEKIEKVKIESCLELLQKSGVDTEQMLQYARDALIAASEEAALLHQQQQQHQQSDDGGMASNENSPYFQHRRLERAHPLYSTMHAEYPSSSSYRQDHTRHHHQHYRNHSIDSHAIHPHNNIDNNHECTNDNSSNPDVETTDQQSNKLSGSSCANNSVNSSPTKSQSNKIDNKNNSETAISIDGSVESSLPIQDQSNDSSNNSNYQPVWSNNNNTNTEIDKNTGVLNKAVVLYEFQADANHHEELDLVVDEEVILLNRPDSDGWVRVKSLMDNKEGIVPVTFLKIFEDESPVEHSYENIKDQLQSNEEVKPLDSIVVNTEDLVRVAYSFRASTIDEMSLEKHDIVKIISRLSNQGVDDGWWEGYRVEWDETRQQWNQVGRGYFPSMVVVKYSHLASRKGSLSDSKNSTVSTGSNRPNLTKLDLSKIHQERKDDNHLDNLNEIATASTAPSESKDDYIRLESEEDNNVQSLDISNSQIKII